MPGRPKRTKDLVVLDEIGVERVEELLATAMPLASVCRELKVGKQALFAWLEGAPERAGLLARARARAAHIIADEVLEIADQADVAEVQVARLRVDTRKWLAARWNAAAYGDQKQPMVNIDLGSMFVDAQRKPAVIESHPNEG